MAISDRYSSQQELRDNLYHNDINFEDHLRLIFVENGAEKEMTISDLFEETCGDFNYTDWHDMKCSLVLNGQYSQREPRSFAIKVVPGTMSYQLNPRNQPVM